MLSTSSCLHNPCDLPFEVNNGSAVALLYLPLNVFTNSQSPLKWDKSLGSFRPPVDPVVLPLKVYDRLTVILSGKPHLRLVCLCEPLKLPELWELQEENSQAVKSSDYRCLHVSCDLKKQTAETTLSDISKKLLFSLNIAL